MNKLTILVLYSFLSISAIAQPPLYKGKTILKKESLDSLKKDIVRNITMSIHEISCDNLFFFKITVGRNGFFRLNELYQTKNDISQRIESAIKATSIFWSSNRSKIKTTLILPIFLIIDKEQGNMSKAICSTLTSQSMNSDTTSIIDGLLIPPVIVNFFKQN